ncbi:MAG: rhomboid family intramembrane serine protease [Anaerolineae bacterium]
MAYSASGDRTPSPGPVQGRPVRLPLPLHRPLWTYVIIVINGLLWLAMTVAGGSENPLVLIRFGAKFNDLIVRGEYWRLISANFLHIGLLHLLFNTYALYILGLEVEMRFGRGRFLALYMLCGLAGSTLSFVGNPALSAGASGAIFGLMGAIIVHFVVYRESFGPRGQRQLSSLLLVAGLNLMFGFTRPGIDNLGHIGGLVGGVVLGWAYNPRYEVAWLPDVYVYKLVDRVRRGRVLIASAAMTLILILLVNLGIYIRG